MLVHWRGHVRTLRQRGAVGTIPDKRLFFGVEGYSARASCAANPDKDCCSQCLQLAISDECEVIEWDPDPCQEIEGFSSSESEFGAEGERSKSSETIMFARSFGSASCESHCGKVPTDGARVASAAESSCAVPLGVAPALLPDGYTVRNTFVDEIPTTPRVATRTTRGASTPPLIEHRSLPVVGAPELCPPFPPVGAWGNSGSWNGWQSWGSDPCVAPFPGGMPVPQVSVQDAVRQMPRDMVQEVVMQVPVPPVQAVEGATVVPQVQIAAKIDSFEVRVPVPQVSVQEGVSQMPKRKRNRERKMKRQRQRQRKELVFFWRGAQNY